MSATLFEAAEVSAQVQPESITRAAIKAKVYELAASKKPSRAERARIIAEVLASPQVISQMQVGSQKFAFVEVNPEIDEMLLRLNTRNRPISVPVVFEICQKMLTGEWVETAESLAVDENGHLQDGQHRLLAFLLTGIRMRVLLVIGTDADAFAVIDQGIGRNLRQVLAMDMGVADGKGMTTLGQGVNLTYRLVTGKPDATGYASKVSVVQARDFTRKNPGLIECVARAEELGKKQTGSRNLGMPKSAALLAVYLTERLYANAPQAMWDAWYEGLTKHVGLGEIDVRTMLISRMDHIRTEVAQNARPHVALAYYLKAAEAFFTGAPIRKLRLGQSERSWTEVQRHVLTLPVKFAL